MPERIKKLVIAFVAIELALVLTFFISQRIMLQNTIDAIKEGDNETVLSLIDKLANVDTEGKGHETILSVACEYGNRQVIHLALDRGADPNKQYGYLLTPIELFCAYGYDAGPEPLQALISAGADVNKYINKPAIIVLAEKSYWMDDTQKATASQEINLLFKSGAALTYGRETVLHYAAKSNMSNLVYSLIRTEQGIALINMLDTDGNTPYQVSVKYGAVAVQRVIRSYEEEIRKMMEDAEREENGEDPYLTEEEILNQLMDLNKNKNNEPTSENNGE